MQEDLRQFVLRRFIEEKKRIQEELRQDSEERQRIDLEKATLEGITLDDIRAELASRHVIDHKVKQETMQ